MTNRKFKGHFLCFIVSNVWGAHELTSSSIPKSPIHVPFIMITSIFEPFKVLNQLKELFGQH